jgi:hypothetical protein
MGMTPKKMCLLRPMNVDTTANTVHGDVERSTSYFDSEIGGTNIDFVGLSQNRIPQKIHCMVLEISVPCLNGKVGVPEHVPVARPSCKLK